MDRQENMEIRTQGGQPYQEDRLLNSGTKYALRVVDIWSEVNSFTNY